MAIRHDSSFRAEGPVAQAAMFLPSEWGCGHGHSVWLGGGGGSNDLGNNQHILNTPTIGRR